MPSRASEARVTRSRRRDEIAGTAGIDERAITRGAVLGDARRRGRRGRRGRRAGEGGGARARARRHRLARGDECGGLARLIRVVYN